MEVPALARLRTMVDRAARRTVLRWLAAAALAPAALAGLPAGAAKKRRHHRKKTRCKKFGEICTQGGKRKCCGKLRCDHQEGDGTSFTVCCKTVGASCRPEHQDCCEPFRCRAETETCQEA